MKCFGPESLLCAKVTRMKRLNLLLLSVLVLGLVPAWLGAQTRQSASLEQTLRRNRWKKRVLLVAAPTAEQADFRAQKALLAANQVPLAARDFLVLDVLYDQLTAADRQFLRQLGLRPPRFAAVLIGKDGGVKARSPRPIAPADLFAIVDRMPMRQQEMQRPATPK